MKVITRILRYPEQWPKKKAQEKGIDVALAIDFVTLAIDKKYDIGVIASADTDLRPALEYLVSRPSTFRPPEVAAWQGAVQSSRLTVPDRNIWCHWLSRSDYDAVADLRDYAPGGGQ
ncbi:MAG: NYN domain-containing protein [Planctomycetes bacterium]|nr:NYN domain-containing protein [Planctomycetota bacterium]